MTDAAEACCCDGHNALTDVLDHMELALGHRGGGLGHADLHLVEIDVRNS